MMKKFNILVLSVLIASRAGAEGLNASEIYLGAGVSVNDYEGYSDDGTGFQVFAGMPIPVNMGKSRLLGEVGYMNAGEADYVVTAPGFGVVGTATAEADGIWANAVVEVPINKSLDLLGRLGLDFGDDDGLMIGGGIGIPVGNKVDVRFEYVIRDHIDSLQANITIGL